MDCKKCGNEVIVHVYSCFHPCEDTKGELICTKCGHIEHWKYACNIKDKAKRQIYGTKDNI